MPASRQSCSAENVVGGDLFLPPWYFRNGHVQTLAGLYLYSPRSNRRSLLPITSTTGQVRLRDGDQLVYQDDHPAGWQPAGRVALLLHGLCGSHASPDVVRSARLLNSQNVRTFRLDWRGCGAGVKLARYPYHGGRSNDLAATINQIQIHCPGSPISVIGFSLGGNITLKLLGEDRNCTASLAAVDRAIAVCPPIDLLTTVTSMSKGWARFYDRYLCRTCTRDVHDRRRQRTDTIVPDGWYSKRARTLYEFDETFTAPVCGFASAADYYARSSSSQFLPAITVPTLIIAAQDDPLIPFQQFRAVDYSSTTKLLSPRHGGHLGFCPPSRGQGWLDRQIIEWTLQAR